MLQASVARQTSSGYTTSRQSTKIPSVCEMRWQIKEMLRSKKCTIDEAIGVAENFAATPGVNGEGKQLVAMLKGLKPWLTKVSIGSQYYTDFINRALRRSNPRLPRPDDFNIRPAQF